MKLTADEALALSKSFRQLSVALGDYRFAHWDELTSGQRERLEKLEQRLLVDSAEIRTQATGLILDEAEGGLAELKRATTKAKAAIKTLKTIKKVINVAASTVGLAAAIMAKDPGAIAKNAKALHKAATADT